MGNYTVAMKEIPPKNVIYKGFVGPYWEIGPILVEAYEWVAKNPDLVDGNIFAFYYDNPKKVSPENCRSAVCIPVKEYKNVPAGFQTMVVEKTQVIYTFYRGEHYENEKFNAYKALIEWIKKNNQYQSTGTMLEIYLTSAIGDNPDKQTEICFLLK